MADGGKPDESNSAAKLRRDCRGHRDGQAGLGGPSRPREIYQTNVRSSEKLRSLAGLFFAADERSPGRGQVDRIPRQPDNHGFAAQSWVGRLTFRRGERWGARLRDPRGKQITSA